MKFSIIAALVVVLAVAHGTEAGRLVKRDVEVDLNEMHNLVDDMKDSFTSRIQDMVEIKAQELANAALSNMEDGRTQIQTQMQTKIQTQIQTKIQPLVAKFEAETKMLQEQLKTCIGNIEKQIRPMLENFNTQAKPQIEDFQAHIKHLTDMIQQTVEEMRD